MKKSILVWLFCWIVSAQMTRVVDGDTLVANMQIWPKVQVTETIRVLGVNTPERGKDGFDEASNFAKEWLSQGDFHVYACEYDSFGRLLGKVYRSDSMLADELIDQGLGAKY